ncbi:hypothetical protein ANO11243_036550 [Dothideomycetidae sp. 11243]|nr:hypothetical protein ANO11243_036550 [fungal sp. No.11243]
MHHQSGLSHNHYNSGNTASNGDPNQSQTHGHAPRSSMHHQPGVPQNHYSSGNTNSNTNANQPQTHGHAPHSSVSSATSGHSYYPPYSHPQPLPAAAMPNYGNPGMSVPGYSAYVGAVGAVNSTLSANAMQSQLMHQSPPAIPSMNMTPASHAPGSSPQSEQMDTSGQVQPSGCKPRVTATLWEDEATLCFQVETNGICVARREDNHMINGTKLLNVAGMTRGRRDGILKSEKSRSVVKIGPMHLKGVWIPYERALEFANKEKITERLYPLFVHNIGSLLYHTPQTAAGRPSIAGSTAPGSMDRRRTDSEGAHPGQTQGLQHHHSMSGSISGQSGHETGDYTHAAGPYGQHRNSYGYGVQAQASIHAGHDASPEMSDPHRASATPRTAAGYTGYSGPMYGNSYAPQTGKRGMELEDDDSTALKRQRMIHEDASRAMISQQKR